MGRRLELADEFDVDRPGGAALYAVIGADGDQNLHVTLIEPLTSRFVACADSAVGSWKPPADRLFATGMPNTAVPTKTSSAIAMIRRGA